MAELPDCFACGQPADPRWYYRERMMCDGCCPNPGETDPRLDRHLDDLAQSDKLRQLLAGARLGLLATHPERIRMVEEIVRSMAGTPAPPLPDGYAYSPRDNGGVALEGPDGTYALFVPGRGFLAHDWLQPWHVVAVLQQAGLIDGPERDSLKEALATVREAADRRALVLRECHTMLGFEPGAVLSARVPEQIKSLINDLKAAAEGLPVRQCPNCGHPQVDYDGFGVLACTRDPQCYCTHPGSTDGVCDICGEKDSDG